MWTPGKEIIDALAANVPSGYSLERLPSFSKVQAGWAIINEGVNYKIGSDPGISKSTYNYFVVFDAYTPEYNKTAGENGDINTTYSNVAFGFITSSIVIQGDTWKNIPVDTIEDAVFFGGKLKLDNANVINVTPYDEAFNNKISSASGYPIKLS